MNVSSSPRAAITKYHKLGGLKLQKFGTSSGGPVVKCLPSNAEDTGSNPGQGTAAGYKPACSEDPVQPK